MIVDVHTHLWESPDQLGPSVAERLRTTTPESTPLPDVSMATYDDAMETVACCVILGFVSRFLKANISAEQVSRYVQRNPKRFYGFAGIDPMIPRYLDTLREAQDMGLVGVVISPPAQDFHPTHSRAMKLYEYCEKNNLPIMVHPGYTLSPQSRLEYSQTVLFDEVARTFPGLKLLFAQVAYPWIDQTLILLSKHVNVYVDLSEVGDRPWQLYNIVQAAYQQGVLDRFLLGSNFPFSTPQRVITNIYSLNTLTQGTHLPAVPREQLRQVVERDALACLGISAPAAPESPARQLRLPPQIKGGIV